jgi:hypothetical protein
MLLSDLHLWGRFTAKVFHQLHQFGVTTQNAETTQPFVEIVESLIKDDADFADTVALLLNNQLLNEIESSEGEAAAGHKRLASAFFDAL